MRQLRRLERTISVDSHGEEEEQCTSLRSRSTITTPVMTHHIAILHIVTTDYERDEIRPDTDRQMDSQTNPHEVEECSAVQTRMRTKTKTKTKKILLRCSSLHLPCAPARRNL